MEQTLVAAEPSTAPEPMQIERGPLVNLTPEQRTEFRTTGNLPKPEDAAPSPEAVVEAKPAADSEPAKPQEKLKLEPKKQTAEERIAQLESTIEKIRKGSGLDKPPKVESAPTKPEPAPATRTKPTPEDKTADGKPKYATYEDYVEELADWKAEQRWASQQREQAEKTQATRFQSKMEDARSRYENFDTAKDTFVSEMGKIQINPAVRDMLNDTEVFPDLIAVIGGTAEEAAAFAKMAQDSPGKAIRYIALTESLIADELAQKAKPVEEAPVKPRTQAPRPPPEAGGRASAPPDGLETAAKANDFRAFKAESTRRALAKFKS